jgi:4-amino-4-deoxy-L-arabinose transferase-like glycosyltransferase
MKFVFQVGALCLICYFTLFTNSGMLNPDVMEARNIVSAREIVQYHNWLIPTLNGEVRIAKPPLPTWLTSLAVLWSGSDDNLAAMRFPAGLAALWMVLFVYGISFRLTDDPKAPFLSASVLASAAFLMFMGRNAAWDIFCHMFMAAAIWALLMGWGKTKGSVGFFILAGVCMGLSFMSKGPISFHSMLLPFLLSYLFAFGRKNMVLKWKETLLTVVICSIISGAWPIYIYFHLPAASLTMASTEAGSWFPSHVKPFWDYLHFPVLSGIWVFFAFSVLVFPHARKKVDTLGPNYTFLFTWLVLTVLLLSAIPKKSTHYLLPVLVPMSLMIGFYLRYLIIAFEQGKQTRGDTVIVTTHAGVITLISISIPGILYYFGLRSQSLSWFEFLIYSVVFIGIGLMSLNSCREKNVFKMVLVTIAFVSLSCCFIPPAVRHVVPQRSFMALMESRNNPEIAPLELYSSPQMDPKEIWAVGRRVTEIDMRHMKLVSGKFPVALFSKTHPDQLHQTEEGEHFSVKLIKVFEDKRKKETWYLSIIDKDRTTDRF